MSASMANMRSQQDQQELDENVTVSIRAGSNMVRAKPLFSPDSKFLFCCTENTIKVFSCYSGDCVRCLRGHTDSVTSLVLNPHNKLQLVSCALDQTVKIWDYTDGILLKSHHLKYPLYGVFALGSHSHSLLLIQKTESRDFQFVQYNSLFSKKINTEYTSIFKKVKSSANCVSVGCGGEYVAGIRGSILRVSDLKSKVKSHSIESEHDLTCVACHPTEHCIATGVSNGRIILWRSFMDSKVKVVKTTYHWHSLEVLDLAFTIEGSYLLSGGHECVLVKWQPNSEFRDVLPRLGAPLCHVTVAHDNCMYATSHSDNVIRLISSNFQSLGVYQGLTKIHLANQLLYPSGLICDPRSKALVLNGRPGHLQMYSVHTDTQLYNLDIVGENYISPENLKRPLHTTEVTKAAFDPTGLWLATVEQWDDGVMFPEIKLKFWHYNKQRGEYSLNTAVQVPHEKTIGCLKFRPGHRDNTQQFRPMAVTTSKDKKFKIWTNIDDTDIYRTNSRWNCESVGYYRDKPAGRCSFAVDGSLLAVVFESSITLWDPQYNVLKQTLVNQSGNVKNIIHVEFGNKSCSHLLVSTTLSSLVVWNLMSCTVSWIVDIHVSCLIPDPLSDIMAVCCADNSVFVFQPSNPEPLFSKDSISDTCILSGVFIPHTKESSLSQSSKLGWQSESQLYLMSEKQDLLTLTIEGQDEEEKTKELQIESNLPQTPFSLLLSSQGKHGFTGYRSASSDSSVYISAKEFTRELLSSASHVQPPVSTLCKSFIQSLLITTKQNRQNASDSNDSDDDSEEKDDKDSDSDMEVDAANFSQTEKTSETKDFSKKEETNTEIVKLEQFDWYPDLLKS